jgi:cytochrome c peroxidase
MCGLMQIKSFWGQRGAGKQLLFDPRLSRSGFMGPA